MSRCRRGVWGTEKLIGKLKDFIAKVRAYFDGLTTNTKAEAALLKEMRDGGLHYLERIVEAYDKAATAAVENYQGAETRSEGGDENGRIHSGQHERNAGGIDERGTENQRGVKDQFAIRDSEGRRLTEAQQDYFKDSKVRDAPAAGVRGRRTGAGPHQCRTARTTGSIGRRTFRIKITPSGRPR